MLDVVSSFVVTDDHTRLAVTTWGRADTDPAILALHPGVGDRRIWQWCAPVWAQAGHRVVAYDRRSFGDTVYEVAPHDDLGDLLAVTAATGVGPAVVVGNSQGGGLALDLALAQPDLVRALVLIAPSPSGYPMERWVEAPNEQRLDQLIADAEERGAEDEINQLEVRYWLDGIDQPEGRVQGPARDLLADMNGRTLAAPWPGEARRRDPVWPRLGQIAAPTLVVAGQHDLPAQNRMGAEVAAAVPGARFVTIPDAAHCPMLDQPAALDRVVLDFVRSLPD